MKGKSFLTFSRRMVRANAWRQARSGLPGEAPPSLPAGAVALEKAGLEIRIEPFLAAGFEGRPILDLKPEEIGIRVGGALVTAGARDGRGMSGRSRNVIALLEEDGEEGRSLQAGLETRLAPSCLRAWETYRDLRAAEKRQMAVDLVAGGAEARSAQAAVRLKLLFLAGRVTGRDDSIPWRMRFEPAWPAGLAARSLDLYNVLLAPPGRGSEGRVLVCERQERIVARESEGLEILLEGEGERVWGIVAVDSESGQGWIRRLAFKVPYPKTKTEERRLP